MLEPSELFPEIPNLYEYPSIHADMLFDQERVSRYEEAISATVEEGDVVADIGTGTGLLAFLCLKAGAKRVHAIERSTAIQWAQLLADRNGYSDRITFHHADSRSLPSLPEKVDVVVSELMGHMAFEEGMIESLFHARDHFLRPGGTIVPRHAELRVALISQHEVYRTYVDCWGTVAGIDYSPLREAAVAACYVTTLNDRDLLSEPKQLFEVDFEKGCRPSLRGEMELMACRSGTVHGIGLWFNADLAPGVRLSSDPWSRTHWQQCFAPIARPFVVHTNQPVSILLEMKLRETPDDNFSFSLEMRPQAAGA